MKYKPIKCVMDGADWLFELGRNRFGIKLYPNQKWLKICSHHDLTECGIAEVEVRFVRWIKNPTV